MKLVVLKLYGTGGFHLREKKLVEQQCSTLKRVMRRAVRVIIAKRRVLRGLVGRVRAE